MKIQKEKFSREKIISNSLEEGGEAYITSSRKNMKRGHFESIVFLSK